MVNAGVFTVTVLLFRQSLALIFFVQRAYQRLHLDVFKLCFVRLCLCPCRCVSVRLSLSLCLFVSLSLCLPFSLRLSVSMCLYVCIYMCVHVLHVYM